MSKQEVIIDLEIIEEEARHSRHDIRTMDNPVLPVARRLKNIQDKVTEVLHQLITGEWKN